MRRLSNTQGRVLLQLGLLAGIAAALHGSREPIATAGGAGDCFTENMCTFKKPNFMIVLDYSSSMNTAFGMGKTRWEVAVEAIATLMTTNGGYFQENMHVALMRYGHDPDPDNQGTTIPGDASGLVDGLRGTANWRLGDWQGYQGSDFEATVDLGEVRKLSRVSSGYLQDARAWIWMPVAVEVALSSDGEHFEVVGRVGHDVDDHDLDQVHLRELELRLRKGSKARYVRVRAENYGTIPDWHPGAGSEAFVFVDEITIE